MSQAVPQKNKCPGAWRPLLAIPGAAGRKATARWIIVSLVTCPRDIVSFVTCLRVNVGDRCLRSRSLQAIPRTGTA